MKLYPDEEKCLEDHGVKKYFKDNKQLIELLTDTYKKWNSSNRILEPEDLSQLAIQYIRLDQNLLAILQTSSSDFKNKKVLEEKRSEIVKHVILEALEGLKIG